MSATHRLPACQAYQEALLQCFRDHAARSCSQNHDPEDRGRALGDASLTLRLLQPTGLREALEVRLATLTRVLNLEGIEPLPNS